MDALRYDIIWLLIAIISGFTLLYFSAIYFQDKNSPFYVLNLYVLGFIDLLRKTISWPFTLPLLIILVIIIIFFLKVGETLK